MVTRMHNQGDVYCALPRLSAMRAFRRLTLLQKIVCCLLQKIESLRARLNSVADRSLTASSTIHSSFMPSRRRPNKTESIDQQPGPSMAIAAQTQMSRIPSFGFSIVIKIINASSSAARIPATGVHSPMSRSPPGIAEVSASKPRLRDPEAAIAAITFVRKYPPDAIRNTSRPAPGHPFGKIENRRCKEASPFFALNSTFELKAPETPRRVRRKSPFRVLIGR